MTQLAFIIPTWNRPANLRRCIESIASQIGPEDDVTIHVIDDGSDVPLRSWAEKLADGGTGDSLPAGVKVQRREQHTDYSDCFRDMMEAAHTYDWVWTFGDDDILRPGALKFVLERLPECKADFIHVAEVKRASGSNNIYHADSFLKLACKFGWIEMSGFITGNIARGFLLAEASGTRYWRQYAKSAFVQSCAILELFRDRPAMFMDLPLVDSQEDAQSEQTSERWRVQNIPGRYLNVVDAIELMFEERILEHKLPKSFFRYLSYHLWDRFVTSYISDYLNQNFLWSADAWGRVGKFAQFIDDEEYAVEMMRDVEAARGMTTLALYLGSNLEGLRNELTGMLTRRYAEVYPYTFVAPPAPVETPAAST